MIITCKKCNANFNLDENLLKPTGSKVRCSKCNEIFVAYPPEIPEEAETPIEIVSDVEDEKVTEDLEPDKAEIPAPDDLDLSDDQALMDEEKAPAGEDVAEEAMDDLELDLDLEMAAETKEGVEDLESEVEAGEADELDLSDLEDLLDKEEEAVSEGVPEEAIEDLDLEMISEPDTDVEKTPESAELEELDELDLSDLEDILDLDEPMAEEESVPEDIELELDMETEPELEQVKESVESEDLEEVDLSEIEKMLEVEEDTAPQEEAEEKPLELELDMEEAPVDTQPPEDDSQVEVFELDEAAEAVEIDEPEAAEPEFVAEEPEESVQEEQIEEVAEEEPVLEKMAAAKERRVSKPLIVLLILALLTGGAYGTYVLLDFMNIEIPYVSDYFKPKVSDPSGNLKIDTLDINSKFILNVKEGKLFVITGRVKNGYSDVRRYININGKLYTKGKSLAQKETVFCGNVLSDIELSNMELVAIKKRLSNRLGDNKSNLQVKPGAELPFMIVFSNLPENLEEFSIEVVSSTSGG